MQIKRLLDDREVYAGDKLFDVQGRSYGFLVHSGGELVVAAEDERPTRFNPEVLGCYVIHVNRTNRGLAIRSGFVIIGKINVWSLANLLAHGTLMGHCQPSRHND